MLRARYISGTQQTQKAIVEAEGLFQVGVDVVVNKAAFAKLRLLRTCGEAGIAQLDEMSKDFKTCKELAFSVPYAKRSSSSLSRSFSLLPHPWMIYGMPFWVF